VIFYVMLALRAELRERGWFASEASGAANPSSPRCSTWSRSAPSPTSSSSTTTTACSSARACKRIRQGQLTPGLRALFRAAGRNPAQASSNDLGFMIGPRLNAAGRLADMSLGIECLITDDEGRAMNIAQQLDALNRERREIESGMQEQALLRKIAGAASRPG
jgi:single-stranded-DNA-specific exonuclease